MNPDSGYRIVHMGSDLIFEKKLQYNYSRISLPGLNESTVAFLKQFGRFYKCNFSKNTFDNQVSIYKSEAIQLFKSNLNGSLVNKAYLHRKIRLCNIALTEDWHSPVFVIKANSHIIATTGHNKIYATALRKKNYNLDFECFVLDIDNNLDENFINVTEINNDDEFSEAIGSDRFALDISFEKTIAGFLPAIMQFSKQYPICYHDQSFKLSLENAEFLNKVNCNNKINVEIHDTHDSTIFDSSGVFNIIHTDNPIDIKSANDISKLKEVNNTSTTKFVTFKKIEFDLSDLFPYFNKHATIYSATDLSYVMFTNDSKLPHLEKNSCPSVLL